VRGEKVSREGAFSLEIRPRAVRSVGASAIDASLTLRGRNIEDSARIIWGAKEGPRRLCRKVERLQARGKETQARAEIKKSSEKSFCELPPLTARRDLALRGGRQGEEGHLEFMKGSRSGSHPKGGSSQRPEDLNKR